MQISRQEICRPDCRSATCQTYRRFQDVRKAFAEYAPWAEMIVKAKDKAHVVTVWNKGELKKLGEWRNFGAHSMWTLTTHSPAMVACYEVNRPNAGPRRLTLLEDWARRLRDLVLLRPMTGFRVTISCRQCGATVYNGDLLRCGHVEYGATASEGALARKPKGAVAQYEILMVADGARLPTDYRMGQLTAEGLQLFLDKGWDVHKEISRVTLSEVPGTLLRANPDTVLRPLPLD